MHFHVIIPTYNRAQLLPRTLDSIVDQSYSDWSIYVVDDGSEDDTLSVLKIYNQQLGGKLHFLHKKNGGVGSARNAGINLALKNPKGNDWCIFLDSDDTLVS